MQKKSLDSTLDKTRALENEKGCLLMFFKLKRKNILL
jgi:hypothetical protein